MGCVNKMEGWIYSGEVESIRVERRPFIRQVLVDVVKRFVEVKA